MADETAATRAIDALHRVIAELEGSEVRHGQEQMAGAVADAFDRREHLLVQAGTGTGKSLAYLVPAVLLGARVVVVTATRALQEQLCRKDLPFLASHAELLGRSFSFTQLKGRSNYLCRAREAELVADRAAALEGINLDDHIVDAVTEWVAETDSGDRADLPVAVPDALWGALSMDSQECPGRTKCAYGDSCFSEMARDRARGADIVVVNTALYGQHLAAVGKVLPSHSYVVIDEAQALEEICSTAFGVTLGPTRIGRVGAHVRTFLTSDDGSDPAMRLTDRAIVLGSRLDACADDERIDLDDSGVREALSAVNEELGALRSTIERIDTPADIDAALRKQRVLRLIDSTREDVSYALGASNDNDAMWVERRTPPILHVARIDVGEPLLREVFARRTAVLSSATLALGHDFGPLAWRLGLRDDTGEVAPDGEPNPEAGDAEADEEVPPVHPTRYTGLEVESPFDFRGQAILYCAAHLPDPRTPKYADAWLGEAVELVRAAGGRTLGLCTSLAAARALRERLSDALPELRVLAPDDLPRAKLMAEFASDETSCLVGSLGLWQGIDVPGPAVTLVIIDKIPFQRPNDPLAVARREQAESQGRDPFVTYDLPRAALLLAQGVGRLVRTRADRGVVAVLDPRLVTKRYGRTLLDSLPPMYRMTSPERARGALERLAQGDS